MCGLAAIILMQGVTRGDIEFVKETFTANLLSNELRGDRATGVSFFKEDGELSILKLPLPVKDFIKTSEYSKFLSKIDSKTRFILGHARRPTKGTPLNPLNNHPIRTKWVVGVHNGHIYNDDYIFFKMGLPREAEVDSEVIFRLFDTIGPGAGKRIYVEKIINLLQYLRGTYATISFDTRYPDQLIVIKNGQPLSFYVSYKKSSIHFSSRYIFLRKLFGKNVAHEYLMPGNGYLFSLNMITSMYEKHRYMCRFSLK